MRSCLFVYLLMPVLMASVDQESIRLQNILLEHRSAAARGEQQSRYIIEIFHKFGTHVPQDYPEAVRRYRRSAEAGHPAAQFLLGFLYENGIGVPQDPIQAYLWYSLAASETVGADREAAFRQRAQVENRMTRRQRKDARQLARARGVDREDAPSPN